MQLVEQWELDSIRPGLPGAGHRWGFDDDGEGACGGAPPPYSLFVRGRLFAVRWRDTTVAAMEEVTSLAERHAATWGDLLYVSVSSFDTEMPGEDTRRAFPGMVRRLSGSVSCVCLLLEGEGFRASALRAVAAGFALVAPASLRWRTFASVDGCAEYLAELGGPPPEELAWMLRRSGIVSR